MSALAKGEDPWGVRGFRKRAPTPPPRDPSGINSIVQHVESERMPQEPAKRTLAFRSSEHKRTESDDSDSSENSACSYTRAPRLPPKAKMDMTGSQKRCSSYENVSAEDMAHGFYPNKPPPAVPHTSSPRRSSCTMSRSSPVECGPTVTPHRSTPSPVRRPHHQHNVHQRHCVPSPSPSSDSVRCSNSGSRHNSPARNSTMSNLDVTDGSNSRWSESIDDSTDSGDLVRRRPPSACKAPRSHRGSMPPGDFMGAGSWGHYGACSPCCASTPIRYRCCGSSSSQTWGHCSPHPYNDQIHDAEDLQQKICQLELEKDQLTLQVTVLAEQVDAQNEKITELEVTLSQNREQLNNSETMLRQEIASRSDIESCKLDLMTQISFLRSKLATVQHEKEEFEERSNKLESELILTCACLAEKEVDLANLRSKLSQNGTITLVSENNSELEKLKEALSSVMDANDEKEKKIQEMKNSLNRYKKLQELIYSNPTRKGSDSINTFKNKNIPFFDIAANFNSKINDEKICNVTETGFVLTVTATIDANS